MNVSAVEKGTGKSQKIVITYVPTPPSPLHALFSS